MKATGIVRRIDDLGRVVIPKEIRRTLRIREGDPLEIFVDREGEVILKKYSPISELTDFAKEYAESLFESIKHPILICDRDMYIAIGGASKKDYLNKPVSEEIEKIMLERHPVLHSNKLNCSLIEGLVEEIVSHAVSPILANGDSIGAVITFSKTAPLSPVELKVIDSAASFLGKQMES